MALSSTAPLPSSASPRLIPLAVPTNSVVLPADMLTKLHDRLVVLRVANVRSCTLLGEVVGAKYLQFHFNADES